MASPPIVPQPIQRSASDADGDTRQLRRSSTTGALVPGVQATPAILTRSKSRAMSLATLEFQEDDDPDLNPDLVVEPVEMDAPQIDRVVSPSINLWDRPFSPQPQGEGEEEAYEPYVKGPSGVGLPPEHRSIYIRE